MGGKNAKFENPKANIINNVEVIDHTSELNSLWYLLLISVAISAISLLLKIYILHKRSLKKAYISRANNIEKI